LDTDLEQRPVFGETTMGFFNGLAYWGKSLLKGIAWPTTKLSGDHKFGPAVRWTLHFLLLTVTLVGLGFVNWACDLDQLIRAPWPLLRNIWLPLVFLQLYLAGWFAWWLSRILRIRPEGSEWPDIDAAWKEATTALDRAGIDLQRVPVYLILGRPAGSMRSLFDAAQVPLSVPQVPRDPKAPLTVSANSEAIYVTCPETSLLGRHASILAEQAAAEPSEQSSSSHDDDCGELPTFPDTMPEFSDHSATCAAEESLQSAVALLVEEEPAPQPKTVPATPLPVASLLEQGDLLERTTSRLKHLCTLMARDRQPYCPINGVLALLPFAASDNELTAGQTTVLFQRDLATVQETLEVRCPLMTLVCDMEKTPGGRELLDRFPENQRHRRLGISFPLLAQFDSANTPKMLRKGMQWTCQGLFPPLVYRLARIRGGTNFAGSEESRINRQLYRLVTQLRERESRLARILSGAICPDGGCDWMVTGCYFAATGEDAVRGQGFAGGIFPQLIQSQNHVAWTHDAMADDRTCRRFALAGYLVLGIGTVAALTLAWLI
jgi:hypothetical protein